jgi:hypothetical protein
MFSPNLILASAKSFQISRRRDTGSNVIMEFFIFSNIPASNVCAQFCLQFQLSLRRYAGPP